MSALRYQFFPRAFLHSHSSCLPNTTISLLARNDLKDAREHADLTLDASKVQLSPHPRVGLGTERRLEDGVQCVHLGARLQRDGGEGGGELR